MGTAAAPSRSLLAMNATNIITPSTHEVTGLPRRDLTHRRTALAKSPMPATCATGHFRVLLAALTIASRYTELESGPGGPAGFGLIPAIKDESIVLPSSILLNVFAVVVRIEIRNFHFI